MANIHCYKCGRLLTESNRCVGCGNLEKSCNCSPSCDEGGIELPQVETVNSAKATDYFIAGIRNTFDSAYGLILAKNHDYASLKDPFANFKNCLTIGLSVEKGIYLRFLDKVARMSNFLTKEKFIVKDESFEDTLLDAINYLAILKAWREKQKEDL